MIQVLGKHLAPPIADSSTGSGAGRERLIIWLVDRGPQLCRSGALDRLGDAIERYLGGARGIRHVAVSVARRPEYGTLTDDAATLARDLRAIGGRPDGQLHDMVGALIETCERYRSYRDRAVVLLSVDNHDVERRLEAAVRLLRDSRTPLFVLSPEATLADSYWFGQIRSSTAALATKARLTLAGAESPIVELPWGWRTQRADPQAAIGAAFASYAFSRLAAASAGMAYLYQPPSQSATPSFCARIGCRLCAGDPDHDCRTTFLPHRLRQLEPDCRDRAQYMQRSGKGAAAAVRSVWDGLRALELVATAAPRSVGPPPGQPAPPRPGRLDAARHALDRGGRVELRPAEIRRLRAWVGWRKQRIEQAIKRLTALARPSPQARPSALRAQANADWLVVMLRAQRFILTQQQLLLGVIERARLTGASRARGLIMVEHVPFCHGTTPLLEVGFWGGEAARKMLTRSIQQIDPLLVRYGGTSWELLVRRCQLIRYTYRPMAAVKRNVKGNTGRGNTGPSRRGPRKTRRPPRPPRTRVPRPPTPRPKRPTRDSSRTQKGGTQSG